MTGPKKCIGIRGRLFGHAFVTKKGNWTYHYVGVCYRCGMKVDGS